MTCVSLKKYPLTRRGYKSFQDWNSDPNHIYIGRDMSHHVTGAVGSKWGYPFKVKKANKNSRIKCLERYEDHVRRNPDLFNALAELEGKELGCWCKPFPCHGDILIKLFKERQGIDPCRFENFSGEEPPERSESFHPVPVIGSHTPLRLTGGAENSFNNQESFMLDCSGSALQNTSFEREEEVSSTF